MGAQAGSVFKDIFQSEIKLIAKAGVSRPIPYDNEERLK